MSEDLVETSAVVASRWRKPAIAVGAGLAALILGKLLLAQPWLFGAHLGQLLLGVLIAVAWRGLAWAGITAVFVAIAPPRVARGLSIAAAPLVALGVSVAESWSAISFNGPAILMLLAIPMVLDAAALLVCAVLGWAISDRFAIAAPTRARVLVLAAGVALLVGGVATIALFVQWFQVYFRLFGGPAPELEPSDPEGVRYLVTAGVAIVATLAAAVLATISGPRGLKITSWILVPAVVVIALLLQVPQGRFDPPPAPEPDLGHYTECAFDATRPGCGG